MSKKNLMISIAILFLLFSVVVNDVNAEEISMDQPFLLSSVGQSPGVNIARALANRAGLDFVFAPVAEPEDLEEVKAVIFVVGGSSKGLGDAGLDQEQEIARVEELFAVIEEKGLPVIGMQLGGAKRRGHLSDEFLGFTFPKVDYGVVMEDANEDGFFTDITEENEIEITYIEKLTDGQKILEDIFINE